MIKRILVLLAASLALHCQAVTFSFTNSTVYVATNGNDTTALRGVQGAAFATIAAGLAVMHPGDTLSIGPGTFLCTKGAPPANSFIVGSGPSLTVVTAAPTAQNFCWQMTNNITFRDMTVRVTAGAGTSGTLAYPFYSTTSGITNVTFFNVTAFGDSDVIIAQPSTRSSFLLKECDFSGFYDTIAIKCTGDGTNSLFASFACRFHTKGDMESDYGFNIGNGVDQTATGFNFDNINHSVILSGFSATTNGFVQGTNLWNVVMPITLVGCQFISEDSKTNICLDLGAADDPTTPLPSYASISGCTFTSRYRTNLLADLISQAGWPTPVCFDLYLSKASTVVNNTGPVTINNVGGTNSYVSGTAPVTSYAAGTAYTLTASPAQLTFGTTSPGITLATAGTYMITGTAGVKYASATYAGAQTITLKLRRTNNTAADLTSGSRAVELPVLTTFTGGDVMSTPTVIYAATAGDIVQLFGSVSATPSAGSVQTDSAEIIAVRLY